MEKEVRQRINSVIEKSHLSITALSKKIGVPQPTLYRQLCGESSITVSVLNSILNYFPDISTEWILRGRGEMNAINQPQQDGNPAKFCGEFEIDNEGYLKLKIR